jgi:TolB-like protein/Tfp pilus assembly protein PilF
MALTSGTKLGPYEIQSPLGAGGMGEVYRATDTKLGRDVALKVLPGEMAQDPERLGRFRREAKTLAQLDHPNIVTIYSVEEWDGIHFLTMQLVEGLPLDRLIPEGGLPVEQIIEIASALGDALAAAHEKGIVHRDLKPANVMVSNEGRVKVLDFGLAKDVRGSNPGDATMTSDSRTQVGVVMGTPAYMSPEQTSGRPLDQRTDIFSIGVLLHEMATGRRPFEGSSSAELVSAILRDTPPSVTELRPNLPGDLARIVRRCLEKDPRHRLQTARDVSNEFRDLARLVSSPISVSTSTSRTMAALDSGASRADEGFWVAVLPFKSKGTDAGLDALAEGITEEIITGMSRFPYLRVIAHGSTQRYANQAVDLRNVGKELGARYVMEGSLRQAGPRLRIAAKLVDATTGTQLWVETYDRSFQAEAIFDLQDDVVPKIVSTVGDTQGILPHSMSEAVWSKETKQLTPYEAVLRSFSYMRRVSPPNHAAARDALERAVEQAPGNGLAWAMLAIIFREEYNHGFNLRPDPLRRALDAASRAVDAEPTNYLAHHALASVQFFRRELQAFHTEAGQAFQLNPMDGFTFGYLGMLTAFAGDWERGCSMSEKARSVNPHHPGWYWFAPLFDAFRKQDYRLVLETAQKVNMPSFWRTNIALAATHGHLGELEPGRRAVRALLAARPEFATSAREECSKWWNPDLVDQIMEGLRKAGLEIPAENQSQPPSGRVSATPSIAVLPFANMSADPEQEYFSDGLAEEIINLLARMAGLKVIARTSSFAFRCKEQDVRKIADTLNVTHILEGSVRRSGSRVRVTAQLIDAADGSHIWSERYDRELSDIFAVQDEISAAIAGTLRVKLSGEVAPERYVPKLPAYEAYLKAKYLLAKVTPESLERAKRCYEQANELDPAFGLARVGLGHYWVGMTIFGRYPVHEAARAARAEAQRALQIDPSLPDAHALLGYLAAIYDRDWAEAERHFDFPLSKQVGTTITRPLYAWFQFWRGNADHAIELAQSAIEEDPLEVWPRMNLHAYLQGAGREGEALGQVKKVLELDENQAVAMVSMAMILADQGDLSEALVIARRAYSVGPWLPETRGVLAGILRRNGKDAESRLVAQSLGSGEAIGEARNHALFHFLCGELDEGADWAEKAIREQDLSMMMYLRFAVCKELRSSLRWPKIARMLNLPL